MIRLEEFNEVCQKSLDMIDEAGILLSPEDRKKMTAADFGLSHIKTEGVQILTMFETDRIAGKILVLLPSQTEPEHWHPPLGNNPGKQEIIRGLWGSLRFYIPGEDNMKVGFIPDGQEENFLVRHELIMKPGDQLVLEPGTKHWFQAGPEGAVLYSFSTTVNDIMDEFTNTEIERETKIIDD